MLQAIFAGTPQLAADILQILIDTNALNIVGCLTQPDKPSGRGRRICASPVKQVASAHNIPVYQPESFKAKQDLDLISAIAPDLVIVVAYGLLIPQNLLMVPKYGWINVHMSLLPRWRGAAPIQHAILAGDAATGVTIMQMDRTLDTGDILSAASFAIDKTATSASLQQQMVDVGAATLSTVLQRLETGNITAIAQDNNAACYAHKIAKQDGKINWQQPAINIDRHIRAFNPAPIAFTTCGNTSVRIWQAKLLFPDEVINAVPGTITAASKHGIEVATREGVISLQVLQLPGKNPMQAAALLNAKNSPFTIGTILQ